jgi:hypothetical protein
MSPSRLAGHGVGLESKAAQCDFTPFCTRAHRLRLPRHQYRLTGEHDV